MKNNATGTNRQALPPNEVHQKWCDQAEHAKVLLELPGEQIGCVGRRQVVDDEGVSVVGWWTQDDVDKGAAFYLEVQGIPAQLSIDQLRAVAGLLENLEHWRQVHELTRAASEAITDFEARP